jgi:hypothetical protein
MTLEEQAGRLWPILVLAARHQQILSYSMLERLTGIRRDRQARPLGRIARFCEDRKYPPLTAVVVNERDGVPGHGYPVRKNVFRDQCRVFVFDWLKFDHPADGDFSKPYRS